MKVDSKIAEHTVVVILAAGRGGHGQLGKVCFEIDSVPAINHQIGAFKRKQFRRFLLVVGSKAEQVLATVARDHPGVFAVYQERQLGTGHAARAAAAALQNMGQEGNVLVTMGDRFIEEAAIEALVHGYVQQQADLALLTIQPSPSPKGPATRVFLDAEGEVIDIIEGLDWARQAIADELAARLPSRRDLRGAEILQVIQKYISSAWKQRVAVGELAALAHKMDVVDKQSLEPILQSPRYRLRIGGERYSARQMEKLAREVNLGLYLFGAEAFYQAVERIKNDNAQGEYYLSDAPRLLGEIRDAQGRRRFRVRAVSIADPHWLQSFNSPDELLAIRDYLRRKRLRRQEAGATTSQSQLKASQCGTVRQWLRKLEDPQPSLRRWLSRTYGPQESLHQEKTRDLRTVLCCFGKRFGFDENVCIVRAPGRINLMGRHVDHRGGVTNFMMIDRETLAVASTQEEDEVVAVHAGPEGFPAVRFRITDLIRRFTWSDWLSFVHSGWLRGMMSRAAGDWSDYLKAAVLRLQHRYQDVKIRGLKLAMCSNVPGAAGLGRSATLVVATLQAAIALNNLALSSEQFIDFHGDAEWFVDCPRVTGDRRAYPSLRGKIVHVSHMPFHVERIFDSPEDCQVIIAKAPTSVGSGDAAKDAFNRKIATSNLGLALLKQEFPQIASYLISVRDINPSALGCTTSDIYRWLLKVPQVVRRKEFQCLLSTEDREMAEANLASHTGATHYYPRGMLLFGAAEVLRGKMGADLLESGQIDLFGELMKISHEGDRVSRRGRNGTYRRIKDACSEQYLHQLIADLASEDPERVLRAQLYRQPGSYAGSTPEIDQMVDSACSVRGVVGAQVAGAGFGGYVAILARKGVAPALRATLEHCCRARRLRPQLFPCTPAEGAGLVEF